MLGFGEMLELEWITGNRGWMSVQAGEVLGDEKSDISIIYSEKNRYSSIWCINLT